MSRKIKPRNLSNTIALIVDGKDEKWYLEKVKQHSPSKSMSFMRIEPDFPDKKKVDDLFTYARNKVEDSFFKVILVLDMDNILKVNSEFERFKIHFERYNGAHNYILKGNAKARHGWMKNLLLVINSPCLEYWYLLHHSKTRKFYRDFNELLPDLRKCPHMNDYVKKEEYYKKSPDIIERLEGMDGIDRACQNSIEFCMEHAKDRGVSEMYKIFDLFDKLDKGH